MATMVLRSIPRAHLGMSKESGRGAWERRCHYISILTGEARTQWGMGMGMSERRTTGRAVPVRVVSCENRYVEVLYV